MARRSVLILYCLWSLLKHTNMEIFPQCLNLKVRIQAVPSCISAKDSQWQMTSADLSPKAMKQMLGAEQLMVRARHTETVTTGSSSTLHVNICPHHVWRSKVFNNKWINRTPCNTCVNKYRENTVYCGVEQTAAESLKEASFCQVSWTCSERSVCRWVQLISRQWKLVGLWINGQTIVLLASVLCRDGGGVRCLFCSNSLLFFQFLARRVKKGYYRISASMFSLASCYNLCNMIAWCL